MVNKILEKLKPTFKNERYYGDKLELPYFNAIGVDEVGRGCLAGDVIACACILSKQIPENILHKINDSKKLNSLKRELLANELQDFCEYSYGVASVEEIDTINILQASMLAMSRALNLLLNKMNANGDKSYFALIDGNKLPKSNIPSFCIIKGDEQCYSIASASILAKVHRDSIMQELSTKYPQYDWQNNAGYGVKNHLNAIKQYGTTKYHRKSFAPIKPYI